jgi:hypothetical protein
MTPSAPAPAVTMLDRKELLMAVSNTLSFR